MQKLELVLKEDGLIVARIPGSPVDIPIIILVRALGLESDKEIASAISLKRRDTKMNLRVLLKKQIIATSKKCY